VVIRGATFVVSSGKSKYALISSNSSSSA
jgi:hypothetical protein